MVSSSSLYLPMKRNLKFQLEKSSAGRLSTIGPHACKLAEVRKSVRPGVFVLIYSNSGVRILLR